MRVEASRESLCFFRRSGRLRGKKDEKRKEGGRHGDSVLFRDKESGVVAEENRRVRLDRRAVSVRPAAAGTVSGADGGVVTGAAADRREQPGLLLFLRGAGRYTGFGADTLDGVCLHLSGLPGAAAHGETDPAGEGTGPGRREGRGLYCHGSCRSVRKVRGGIRDGGEGRPGRGQPDLPNGHLRVRRMGGGGRSRPDFRLSGHPDAEGPLQRALAPLERGNLRPEDAAGLERGQPDAGAVFRYRLPGPGSFRRKGLRHSAARRRVSLL